ncbi:cation/H(+) antiporter 4-like [Juglans microcarpa x Juglans regia]|uniref:cation/H(+) antiporter 4-like n=1 Tax=Juglans microcarpa x Juglans regia TaxID=2249226 RepID=UPI001B7DB8EE|nr:cation/H(+) antiporter 4-like [Juglans microcarpa x Juglans regia]
MDMKVLKRTGRIALYTGIACILFPLIIGLSLGLSLKRSWLTKEEAYSLPFLTVFHSLTPFPVVVYLLEKLKILNSELGQLGLSTALVSETISLFLVVLATFGMVAREKGYFHVIIVGGSAIIYFLIVVFVFRPAMVWIVKQTPEGRPVKTVYIHIIMLLMLVSGMVSHLLNFTAVFGPFCLGLAVPDGPPLGSAIVNKFNCFTEHVLLPLFVTICAMKADLRLINFGSNLLAFDIIHLIATFAAKMLACLIPLLYSKMPINDALALALILSFKGQVQLKLYSYFGDDQVQLIPDQAHSLWILAILINATIAPILVKYLYDPSRKYAGYKKRDIMHNRSNAELRILVCIHKPDNIPTVIKLLEASGPTRQRPLTVYVLHLIKLIGRASPVFISHQMQKKTLSKTSYSENVIIAFNRFKQDNLDGISLLHVFTAISPPKYMHEDVCTLALDKLACLIVLPFHQKWSLDGFVESEDCAIRTLNCGVLELAPCSVGILVDRGRSTIPAYSSYSVAMIFLGGSDDQEALTLAKRMANDKMNINLTVVHFVASGSEEIRDWDDNLLDHELLKDVKLNNVSGGYVTYIEEMVEDAPQTALIIHSMINEYDLIIVGRRHNVVSPQTSGLAEWSEFPELGIIGDLLASTGNNTRTSVLVVQQQHQDIHNAS